MKQNIFSASKKKIDIEMEPQHWFSFFQEKLRTKVHLDLALRRCFKASVCNRPAPDHFPSVFWKAPFVFNREQWQLADDAVPNLYRISIKHPNAPSFCNDIPLIEIIANYAIWRGCFSWLYSLTALYYQRRYFHSELFQLTTLCLAYHGNFDTANFYYQQIVKHSVNISSYYQYCFSMLMDLPLPEQAKQEGIADSQDTQYLWLVTCCSGDTRKEKKIANRMTRIDVDEERLIEQYSCLVMRGLLLRANIMVLRYMIAAHKKEHCGHLMMLVLQSYLQNQKYYTYLLRLTHCEFWPGEACWYEAEYCMMQLGLHAERKRVWQCIQNGKKETISLPSHQKQRLFHQSFLQKTENNPDKLPQFFLNTPSSYKDLLIDHYLSTAINEQHVLQRRYGFYHSFLLKPLIAAKDLKPSAIMDCSRGLFWTFYLYLDSLRLSPFIKLLESLGGQVLSLRLLLASYHFRYGSGEQGSKLLSSVAQHHPLFQTMRVSLALKEERLDQADKIAHNLAKKFPQDLALHNNHALIRQKLQCK